MLKPFDNRVVVKPIPVGDKTSGGVVLSPDQKRPPNKGVVIAGNDEVSTGQTILFHRRAGVEYKGQLILLASDVLAILHVTRKDN